MPNALYQFCVFYFATLYNNLKKSFKNWLGVHSFVKLQSILEKGFIELMESGWKTDSCLKMFADYEDPFG